MPTPKKKKSAKKKATKKMRPGRKKKAGAKISAIQRQFLDAVRVVGDISKAAGAVGVSRQHHYKAWMKEDAYAREFKEMLKEAEEVRRDEVRAEIHKLGFEGWEEEVVEQEMTAVIESDGSVKMRPTRTKRKMVKRRSIAALLWEGNMLCGNPARVEVTGKDGGPLDARVSVEAFRRLAGLD